MPPRPQTVAGLEIKDGEGGTRGLGNGSPQWGPGWSSGWGLGAKAQKLTIYYENNYQKQLTFSFILPSSCDATDDGEGGRPPRKPSTAPKPMTLMAYYRF